MRKKEIGTRKGKEWINTDQILKVWGLVLLRKCIGVAEREAHTKTMRYPWTTAVHNISQIELLGGRKDSLLSITHDRVSC
jgi:hypothetical protein